MKVFTEKAKPFSGSKNGTAGLNVVTAFEPGNHVLRAYPGIKGRTATLYSSRGASDIPPVYFFDTDEIPELKEHSLRFEEEQRSDGVWVYYFDINDDSILYQDTVRTRLKLATASGKRTSWFKIVNAVDMTKKDGYAFHGKFLETDKEIELPVGAIVIEKEPCGSVKSPSSEGNIYRVVEKPADRRNPHLQLLDCYRWRESFLSFRDRVAYYLQAAKEEPDEVAGLSEAQIKINNLDLAINKLREAKLLVPENSSPYNAISNAEQICCDMLDLLRKCNDNNQQG